jgi:hypothetical protein
MIILVLFGIFLNSFRGVECSVYKCCPDGYQLNIDAYEDNNLAPQKLFTCEIEQRIANESLNFIGFNIIVDNVSHIPTCSDSRLQAYDILENLLVLYSDSCVDVKDEQYYVIFCNEADVDGNSTNIFKTRKCCPSNYSYDVLERMCVENSNGPNVNNYTHIFNSSDSSIFEVGLSDCPSDSVEIEYQSVVHKLHFIDNEVIVFLPPANHAKLLSPGTFCIENTYKVQDVSSNLERYSKEDVINSRKASKWIVKACEPKQVCDVIPCIRKCCKDGQRRILTDEPHCEPHSKGLIPTFHFFEMKDDKMEFKPVEPLGMII